MYISKYLYGYNFNVYNFLANLILVNNVLVYLLIYIRDAPILRSCTCTHENAPIPKAVNTQHVNSAVFRQATEQQRAE